jgi:hypothetical protein
MHMPLHARKRVFEATLTYPDNICKYQQAQAPLDIAARMPRPRASCRNCTHPRMITREPPGRGSELAALCRIGGPTADMA